LLDETNIILLETELLSKNDYISKFLGYIQKKLPPKKIKLGN